MILEATYVASFDSDSLCLISGFCEMLWQPFYTFLTKEPKSLCYYVDKKKHDTVNTMNCAICHIINKATLKVH